MSVLIILICLISDPATCREEQPFDAVPSQQCALFGQSGASQYLDDHPKWRLKSWRCQQGAKGIEL